MSWNVFSAVSEMKERPGLRGLWSRLTSLLSGLWPRDFRHQRGRRLQPSYARPDKQVAFTIALVGLAAKLAKADGVAVEVEAQAFQGCFYVPENERANIKRMYDLAAKDTTGFDVYADRIANLLAEDRPLLKDVFECLFNIAAADGILHEAEESFLKTVADKFGLDRHEYLSIRHLFVRDPASPYEILDVDPSISDAELKAHHRRLVRENHPDKLVAEGVPEEFLVLADRKLAAINAAYDEIRQMRGL